MATTHPQPYYGPPPVYGQVSNHAPANYQPPPQGYGQVQNQVPANYQQPPPQGYGQAQTQVPANYQQPPPQMKSKGPPQIKAYTISRGHSSVSKHLTLTLESASKPTYFVDSGKKMTFHPTLTMTTPYSASSITAQSAPMTSRIEMTSVATKTCPALSSEFHHEHGEGGGAHSFTHPLTKRVYYWKRTHDPMLTAKPGDGLRQDLASGHLKCVDAQSGEVVAVYIARGLATSSKNFGRFELYETPGHDSEEWQAWVLFAGVLLEEKRRDESKSSSSSSAAAIGGGGT